MVHLGVCFSCVSRVGVSTCMHFVRVPICRFIICTQVVSGFSVVESMPLYRFVSVAIVPIPPIAMRTRAVAPPSRR